MSSVGSSDSSNRQDEIIRRNREEAKASEADLVKKQKAEMRRLNENHYAELENVKQNHAAQMQDLRKASTDAISERDHRYLQEVEDLRGMHRKAMEQTANESNRREEALRKANKGDLESTKSRNEDRFEKLNSDFNVKLNESQKATEKMMGESRDAQARAIAENRDKLERAYEKQIGAVKDERDEKVKGLQNQYTDYRQNAEGRIKSQELRHMQDQKRSGDNLIRTVQQERQSSQDTQQILRDGFQDGLETQRERFEKAAKNERMAQSMVSESMKTSAVDRIDNQVRRLENEKEDLKNARVRDQLLSKQAKESELRNIRDSYGKNIQNFQEQRDEAVRMSNELSAKDVAHVRKEMGKQLTDTNRFYRGRLDENNKIQRSAMDNITAEHESRQTQTQLQADQRVKHIFDQTQDEKMRLIEQQAENHTLTQQNRADEMKALREQLEQEKQEAIGRMQDQIRKQEVAHTEKLSMVVSKYEKQLTSLKDQVVREKRNGEENLKRTVDELQRAHKISLDQVESKNKDRMRQMTNVQSEELRTVNKRHEEKLDQVLAEVKKT